MYLSFMEPRYPGFSSGSILQLRPSQVNQLLGLCNSFKISCACLCLSNCNQQPLSLLPLKLLLYHSWSLVLPAWSLTYLYLLCEEQPHGKNLWTYVVPLLRQRFSFSLFSWKSIQVAHVLCLWESRRGKELGTEHSKLWTEMTKEKIGRHLHEKCLLGGTDDLFFLRKQKWGNWRQQMLSLEKKYGFFYHHFLFFIFYYWQKMPL